MGNFISLSAVINKTQDECVACLSKYTSSKDGGMEQDQTINQEHENCCIVQESYGNTTVLFPPMYDAREETSEYISKELNATVFSLEIYDSDLWMYVLYNDGKIIDRSNPVPNYWDMNKEEMESWKGNAFTIAKYLPYINPVDIERYLVRWESIENDEKANFSDEYCYGEDWQMLDFMGKIRASYPIDDKGNPTGQTYRLWTEELRLTTHKVAVSEKIEAKKKPWWKFF